MSGAWGEFVYFRRKLVFGGHSFICFAPSNLGTAEVIGELLRDVASSHADMEKVSG